MKILSRIFSQNASFYIKIKVYKIKLNLSNFHNKDLWLNIKFNFPFILELFFCNIQNGHLIRKIKCDIKYNLETMLLTKFLKISENQNLPSPKKKLSFVAKFFFSLPSVFLFPETSIKK